MLRVIKLRGWAGHVARTGAMRTSLQVFVGKPEGKRPLGRHRRRWEDNIIMHFRKTDESVWTEVTGRMITVMNIRVP
jgi:hypothetical protein